MLDAKIFEALPGNSAVLLPNPPLFTIIAVSDDFVRSTGVPRAELVGRGFFEKFPESPIDPDFTGEQNIRASLKYVLQNKKPHSLPQQRYDLPNADGSFTEKYWRPLNLPILDETGKVLYLVHTAEDMTILVKSQKTEAAHHRLEIAYQQIAESQAALSLAHERIKDILESTNDAFYAVDAGFHFTYVNKRAAQLWGVDRESLLGQHYWTVFPKAVNSESYYKHYEVLEKHQPVHYETISPIINIWIDTSIYPGKDGGLSVFFRDISERKKAEMVLKESEERFRIMADAVPQSIWITDATGNTEFLNKHWLDYCGEPYTATTAADIGIRHLHPEDAPKVMKVFGRAMQTGEPWEIEQRNRSKEGEYRWFLNRASPYRDPVSGAIVKWIGVGVDIHDRKLAEEALRRSEEALEKKVRERTRELGTSNQELQRSNKNLEDFAYAASHDLKEPIRKIHFFANRLKESLEERMSAAEKTYFERMEVAARRMNTLIDDLLMYSEVSHKAVAIETVNLNELAEQVLNELDLEIEQQGASINVGALCAVPGARRQLQQVLHNLITNSLKYRKPGVPPVITITSKTVLGSKTGQNLPAVYNDMDFCLLSVTDNGIGFAQEDAARIFNVFTRLHGNAEYKGTGVGLSIVRKVVDNHGGYIWAEGWPDEGARFNLLLPLASVPVAL